MSVGEFPIMASKHIKAIPLALITPHEAQAVRNHSQSLKRLAERGGLDPSEAVAVLENRLWHRMPETEAEGRLTALVDAFKHSRVTGSWDANGSEVSE